MEIFNLKNIIDSQNSEIMNWKRKNYSLENQVQFYFE